MDSPSELRRLIGEAVETTSRLDAERYALEEIRDDLQVRERDLADQLAAADHGGEASARRIATRTEALRELSSALDAVQRENRAAERRCVSAEIRLRELDGEIETLTAELHSLKDGALAAVDRLESVHESILRMDRKLSFARRKHHRLGGSDQLDTQDVLDS